MSKSKGQLVPLTLTLSRQGRENYKGRLPRRLRLLAMTSGKGLAMTREVGAPARNTGITKAHQTASANMELHSYQAFALAR